MVLSHPVYCQGCFQKSRNRDFFDRHIVEQDLLVQRNGKVIFASRDPHSHRMYNLCKPIYIRLTFSLSYYHRRLQMSIQRKMLVLHL